MTDGTIIDLLNHAAAVAPRSEDYSVGPYVAWVADAIGFVEVQLTRGNEYQRWTRDTGPFSSCAWELRQFDYARKG